MKNIKIKIRLVGVFLRWCWMYPLDIKENYQDIKTRYFFETDDEMQKLLAEIQEL
jgi:hypothetical protein